MLFKECSVLFEKGGGLVCETFSSEKIRTLPLKIKIPMVSDIFIKISLLR